jgi:hypothetical protein
MSDATTAERPESEPVGSEQPYEWGNCTVRLSIIIHPEDNGEGGRPVTLGCNTHHDPPIYESTRETALGLLPPVIVEMLEKLKLRLPQQAEIAKSRRQAEAEAAKKREIERQQVKARAEAASQKSQAKQIRRPAPSPTPEGESKPDETLFALGQPSSAAQDDSAAPVTGEQQLLFD